MIKLVSFILENIKIDSMVNILSCLFELESLNPNSGDAGSILNDCNRWIVLKQ